MKTKHAQVLIVIVVLLVAACEGGGRSTPGPWGAALRIAAAAHDIAPAAICPDGGVAVSGGIDTNGNGFLDPSEAVRTQRVCNGENGLRTLLRVAAEPAGVHCAAGGKRISAGRDLNGNAALDEGEIVASDYFCNGATGTQLAYPFGSAYRLSGGRRQAGSESAWRAERHL